MRYQLIVSAIVFLFGCKSTQPTVPEATRPARELIKEYAYCKCLEHASPDSNIVKNDVSLGVYYDIGGYGDDAFTSVDSLARITANEMKPSIIRDHQGEIPVIKRCFDFFWSKQLDSLVNTYNATDGND